jgi:hypothetical protein
MSWQPNDDVLTEYASAYLADHDHSKSRGASDEEAVKAGIMAIRERIITRLRSQGLLLPIIPDDVFLISLDDRDSIKLGHDRQWLARVSWRNDLSGRRAEAVSSGAGDAIEKAIKRGIEKLWKAPLNSAPPSRRRR